jgi:DNA polymerase
MESQVPFTGGSGCYLDRSFEEAGIAKRDAFITNVVHCHPRGNRKSLPTWVSNCSPYLHLELKVVQPKLVIGLGQDARKVLERFYDKTADELERPFRPPRTGTAGGTNPHLLFTQHPSWIQRQHDDGLDQKYVTALAEALKWAFRGVKKQARRR